MQHSLVIYMNRYTVLSSTVALLLFFACFAIGYLTLVLASPLLLACSFRDATCLEALIEPRESNVYVRETNLANTNASTFDRCSPKILWPHLCRAVHPIFSIARFPLFFYFSAHEILFQGTRKKEFC